MGGRNHRLHDRLVACVLLNNLKIGPSIQFTVYVICCGRAVREVLEYMRSEDHRLLKIHGPSAPHKYFEYRGCLLLVLSLFPDRKFSDLLFTQEATWPKVSQMRNHVASVP